MTRITKILKADVSSFWEMMNPFTLVTCFATVDYNSWIESPKALKLASKLDKDVVLAEGMLYILRPSDLPFRTNMGTLRRLQAI